MKKELAITFFVFILFGIMLNSFVIANNGNMKDTAVISAIINGQVIQAVKERERIREETVTVTNEQGMEQRVFVRVERETGAENGKVYLKIKYC